MGVRGLVGLGVSLLILAAAGAVPVKAGTAASATPAGAAPVEAAAAVNDSGPVIGSAPVTGVPVTVGPGPGAVPGVGPVPVPVAAAPVAGAAPVSGAAFGAAIFVRVGAGPSPIADVEGVAPVSHAPALTLTRAVDAGSAQLRAARTGGTHFKTVSVAWSTSGGVQSLCLQDVAVTSYATRGLGGSAAVEHTTLFFAAAARAAGTRACERLAPAPPVLVRLFRDPRAGLSARVDCLLMRCVGTLRLSCPSGICPRGGISVGGFDLSAGGERVIRVPSPGRVRGRHPRLTTAVLLRGRTAAIVSRATVDPPPPMGLAAAVTGAASPSLSPTPAGAPAAPAGPTAPPPSGASPGTGTPSVPDGGPVLGAPGGPPAVSGPAATTLQLSCDGPAGAYTSVHGVLGPSLAGAAIEINYVPADRRAEPMLHFLTTAAGGQFNDPADAPFVSATASFAGSRGQAAAAAACP
jgi:hypothetical protein